MELIGVLDIGTSSVRFIIFNLTGEVAAEAYQSIRQFYPRPGWVEEDPLEIWEASQKVIIKAIREPNVNTKNIIALGITNQRESTLIWDKFNGNLLSKLIVWQDRRTSARCDELKNNRYEDLIKNKTGLTIDPYFSATKLEWLLKNNFPPYEREKKSNLAFGTVDSWIIFKLTGKHLTDASNASRTMLFNIHDGKWDNELLNIFNVPENILPEVLSSYGNAIYGYTKKDSVFNQKIPLCSVFGDQQAALFGQRCFQKGDLKSTFGTGSFIMMNTGTDKILSKNNLLTTIFYKSDCGKIFYALEGSVYNTGSIFQWLKDGLGLISSYDEIEILSSGLDYRNDLYIVPALTGLGAPHWDPYARGMIIGLTRSTSKNEIIRAAMESIAYRTRDVTDAMEKDCGIRVEQIKIDGGVSQNNLFCQILSDLTGIKIIKFDLKEITALGAMYGAALGIGLWKHPDQIKEGRQFKEFSPVIDSSLRENLYRNWCRALSRSKKWIAE